MLTLFNACKESIDQSTSPTTDEVYKYIQKLGYSESAIKDMGDYYLVGEDIVFSKNLKFEANPESHLAPGTVEDRQYGGQSYIAYSRQPNITIKIDATMTDLANLIQGVVNLYNSIPNCRLHLSITTGDSPDILIKNSIILDDLNILRLCGTAPLPVNGRAGATVEIDRAFITSSTVSGEIAAEQIQRTIIHEIGHAIGLKHTNWAVLRERTNTNNKTTASNIFGTTTDQDANSQMNGQMCGRRPAGFSPQDIIAIQQLYPANPPVAGSVPVFRYFDVGTGDHFYTTSINELDGGNTNSNLTTGYRFEGVGFFAFPTQVANSVPVFRYFNTGNGDHFYTTNFNELKNGGNGWVLENRQAFFVYTSAINGSLPILRFYNGKDHFYTKNTNEFATPVGMGTYRLEQTAFFAF